MAERSFTLLELHFHNHGGVELNAGSDGGPAGLVSRLRRRRNTGTRDDSGGRRTGLPGLLPVVAIAVAALVVLAWQSLRGR